MKILKLIVFAMLFLNVLNISSQNTFQISTRVGYDFPTYNNNTPYIDYKGGLEIGASLDYYWSWLGVGIDYDYIMNKPENSYPTTIIGSLPADYSLSEKKITRTFLGIGPNFKYGANKFMFELNTRVGISSLKGGRTLLEYNVPPRSINFHAGYNQKSVFSSKVQARVTYFFNEKWGVNVGAYYLRHFNVKEEVENGISAMYHPFTENSGNIFLDTSGAVERVDPCAHDISSIGVFAGLSYKFSKKKKKVKKEKEEGICNVCGQDHAPHCCATCGCDITITARDKFSSQVLPNTDVALVGFKGNIVQTGTTNSYGIVVFKDVAAGDYIIKGQLYNIDFDDSFLVEKAAFKDCIANGTPIQKEIIYDDLNFILRGNVVECNTPNGIQGVAIVLKDRINTSQKNTLSNSKGDFIFHLKTDSTYELSGNKNGYFSNKVEVSTSEYDRASTIFIGFEMCVDPCGKSIVLDNINFDLAKWDILPLAIPDLQKIVELMEGNPSIMVEISSHTDSRGGNEYNQKLSQKRAQSTVDYLISKGVDRSRLIARGAGETELLNRCSNSVACSKKEHRINRRTEFKVVCNN